MDGSIDYRLVCRTCLASEAEFYKLDARTFMDDDDERISFRECLKYCTKLEDYREFPIYICTECSTALQVAYNFMKNALEAHEILRKKLLPSQPTRVNGQLASCGSSSSSSRNVEASGERKVSFRCKICNERVETKRSLKEHVKLHLDIITYSCELCEFQTKTRSNLNDHFMITHGLIATREQLKPKANTNQAQNLLNIPPQSHNTTAQQPNATVQQLRPNLPTHQEVQQKFNNNNVVQIITNQYQPYQTQQIVQQTPMNVAQFLASSDLQQIPIQMATVIGAEPNQQIDLESDIQNYTNELSMGNEIIGNEYVVMQDGTVQEVMSNGVVINYIDTGEGSVALDNGIYINNLMVQPEDVVNVNDGVNMVNGTIETDLVNVNEADDLNTNAESETVNMEIDDIIVEDNVQNIAVDDIDRSNVPVARIQETKAIRCKMCKSAFALQEDLKEHMLTHNEIPHFFCELCSFYTFFKIDLTQHYKTKHQIQPNTRQLQPKNKVNFNVPDFARKVYVCEMCIYDTPVKAILRRHYLSKHQIEANEVQLRPMKVTQNVSPYETEEFRGSKKPQERDFPNGINCTKCSMVFYSNVALKEHCKQHNLNEMAKRIQAAVPTNTTTTTSSKPDPVPQPQPNNTTAPMAVSYDNNTEIDVHKLIGSNEMTPSLNTSSQPDGVPPDAIPQIVETDSIVDNILDFEFNGDAIFEDDSEENDDGEFADYDLTTDDEQEYVNNSSIEGITQKLFCIQCNKKFVTHYEFENHMFVHRGLAPYRCGMCTNLYNTKRDLMRHYLAVHKIIPTRDMIQAKGDKAVDPGENSELERMLNAGKSNEGGFLCAKCPFETAHVDDMKVHLNVMHGVDDENYMLQKLPHECPKCIRTFDSNLSLVRHIDRNHSSNPICQINKDNNDNISSQRRGLRMSDKKDHIAKHNGLRLYECDDCDQTFYVRSKLKKHIDEHHPESVVQIDNTPKQLNCKHCHKTYRSETALNLHLRRHTGRKHSCDLCPKMYVTASELKNHMLTHTSDYPYGCDLCNKAFRYRYHLKRHNEKNHTERRYACEATNCKKNFISVLELQWHVSSHDSEHFDRVYKCENCPEQCYTRDLLHFHLKSVHQIELSDEAIEEEERHARSEQNELGASSSEAYLTAASSIAQNIDMNS